jgi:hypothetical protein
MEKNEQKRSEKELYMHLQEMSVKRAREQFESKTQWVLQGMDDFKRKNDEDRHYSTDAENLIATLYRWEQARLELEQKEEALGSLKTYNRLGE